MIGAGSVVTHDVPAGVTAFGNPARLQTRRRANRKQRDCPGPPAHEVGSGPLCGGSSQALPGNPDRCQDTLDLPRAVGAQRENAMAASSKLMVREAERRFPCRIKLGTPTGGFGIRLTEMHAWLDENCGADGWVMTPAGLRGVINDAVAIYFLDAALAAAFVSRWCAGSKVEITEGALRVREDRPMPRAQARAHKTF
jgi:hypothetical protein